VRPTQMPFFVSIRSLSASVAGKLRRNLRSPSIHPSGMSAAMPPTRVSDVVRRAPTHPSSRL
jgi:hypothetical protein